MSWVLARLLFAAMIYDSSDDGIVTDVMVTMQHQDDEQRTNFSVCGEDQWEDYDSKNS
jgi:hypothetical protein